MLNVILLLTASEAVSPALCDAQWKQLPLAQREECLIITAQRNAVSLLNDSVIFLEGKESIDGENHTLESKQTVISISTAEEFQYTAPTIEAKEITGNR